MKIYLLHHTYYTEYDQETKFLGVYSSEEKIKEAIEIYYELPGFNKLILSIMVDTI